MISASPVSTMDIVRFEQEENNKQEPPPLPTLSSSSSSSTSDNPSLAEEEASQSVSSILSSSLASSASPSMRTSHSAPMLSTSSKLIRRSSLKKFSSYGSDSERTDSSRSGDGKTSLDRSVSFGNMQIRQYNVTISDNPSCSHGPPIQLSWEYKEDETVVPLEAYEEVRKANPPRKGGKLLLSLYDRHDLLVKQAGCSKKEIKETMKEVKRIKRERMVTDLLTLASPVDETMEQVMQVMLGLKRFFPPMGTSFCTSLQEESHRPCAVV